MNKVFLIGRVGQPPEIKTFDTGNQAVKFTLATTDGYGEKAKTTWHNVQIWGDYGVKMAQYFSKGSLLGVEGKIDNSSYEKDGVKSYFSQVICEKLELLDSKSGSSENSPSESQQESKPTKQEKTVKPKPSKSEDIDDDLPF